MTRILAAAALLAVLMGCGRGSALAPYLGPGVTARISPEIRFPDGVELVGFDLGDPESPGGFSNEIYGRLTEVSIQRRLSDMTAGTLRPYSETLVECFRGQLRTRRVFAAVVESGGDVTLLLEVERYGLIARNARLDEIRPVLEVKATLLSSEQVPVWSERFSVPEYSTHTLKTSLEELLQGDWAFKALFRSACEEIAEELVRRMR